MSAHFGACQTARSRALPPFHIDRLYLSLAHPRCALCRQVGGRALARAPFPRVHASIPLSHAPVPGRRVLIQLLCTPRQYLFQRCIAKQARILPCHIAFASSPTRCVLTHMAWRVSTIALPVRASSATEMSTAFRSSAFRSSAFRSSAFRLVLTGRTVSLALRRTQRFKHLLHTLLLEHKEKIFLSGGYSTLSPA